jgi:hypothetical protein
MDGKIQLIFSDVKATVQNQIRQGEKRFEKSKGRTDKG